MNLYSVFNVIVNVFDSYLSPCFDYFTNEEYVRCTVLVSQMCLYEQMYEVERSERTIICQDIWQQTPEKRKRIFLRTLRKLQHCIEKGDIKNIKKIIDCFHQNLAENKQLLSEIYTSGDQCITQTDLILAACQNKEADVLHYILRGTDILLHLPDGTFNDTKVNKRRTEAIKHALRLKDFNKVEMLYDYWCGNLHWSGYDRKNIKMAGKVLKKARHACPKDEENLQANIYCLIHFNAFQLEIYKGRRQNKQQNKNKRKRKKTKTKQKKYKTKQKEMCAGVNKNNVDNKKQHGSKEMATILLNVLQIYNRCSQIEMIRKQHTIKKREQIIKASIADDSSTFYKNLEYIYYKVYFRKIDLNVSLLILENLYVIRKHLKTRFNKTRKYFKDNPADEQLYEKAVKTYKEIESGIYHFIYRTSEDWRFYLPENRRVTIEQHFVIDDGKESIIKQTLDVPKLRYGPVIYLERECFKGNIEKFKAILKDVRDDPAVVNEKKEKVKKLLNDHYLKTVSYMRDHYSLVKIVYYIEAIENTAKVNVVMIERVLHVVGEMLKSTDNTLHLSRSTQALLQTAISVETVRHLQNIRNFLSRGGKLSARINMAITHAQTFEEIRREMIVIKEIINPILGVFESIVDRSLLETGARLLEQRIESLPDEAKRRVNGICNLHKMYGKDVATELDKFYQDEWRHTDLSLQLLKEILWTVQNKADILEKLQLSKQLISDKVVSILPSIIPNVRQMLSLYGFVWFGCLYEYIYNRRISTHLESVKGMLTFCLRECERFASIKASVTDKTTPKEAYSILTKLEDICAREKSYYVRNSILLNNIHFIGIERLYNDQINSIKKLNDARQAREELISCLISRLDLLKQTLLYPQEIPFSQFVQRFDHDVEFRITIEMVLADIANVLGDCGIRLMYKSSKLLRDIDLGDVLDHGNPFLDVLRGTFNYHDLADELLNKAMMFAEDAESIQALYKLFEGKMEYDIILEGDLLKMDDQQQQLYKQFMKSSNWESYALLARYSIP